MSSGVKISKINSCCPSELIKLNNTNNHHNSNNHYYNHFYCVVKFNSTFTSSNM